MTDRRESRLKVIRDLLARAASTEYEAERDSCLAKADELQTKFQIEEWELAQSGDTTSKLSTPIRRNMDCSWYMDEGKYAVRSALWSMFLNCADHCRCVVAHAHTDWKMKVIPVFGLENDIDYLDMLFTNLFLQMLSKVKPKFDPDKSLGYNVYNAKEAGMKYRDIAIWAGHPEWIKNVMRFDKRKGYSVPKQEYDGIMIREMKKYAKEHGLEVHKEQSLAYYLEDYCTGFVSTVNLKLTGMRDEQGQSEGSMAIALRDMRDLAREAMFDDFPDMRPHPDDCDCDKCHRCYDPDCQRPRCKAARKPAPKAAYRNMSVAGAARGRQAGREAQITQRGGTMPGKKRELN